MVSWFPNLGCFLVPYLGPQTCLDTVARQLVGPKKRFVFRPQNGDVFLTWNGSSDQCSNWCYDVLLVELQWLKVVYQYIPVHMRILGSVVSLIASSGFQIIQNATFVYEDIYFSMCFNCAGVSWSDCDIVTTYCLYRACLLQYDFHTCLWLWIWVCDIFDLVIMFGCSSAVDIHIGNEMCTFSVSKDKNETVCCSKLIFIPCTRF